MRIEHIRLDRNEYQERFLSIAVRIGSLYIDLYTTRSARGDVELSLRVMDTNPPPADGQDVGPLPPF